MDNTDDILKNYRGKYSQYWIERWGLIPELPTSFDNANSIYELTAWLQRAFKNLLDDFQQLESEFEDFKNALVDLLEYLIPELIRRYHDSSEFRASFISLLMDILEGEERTWLKDFLKELLLTDMLGWFKNYVEELYDLELKEFVIEVTNARGGYDTLSNRLSSVDTKVSNIISGSPKSVYANLYALQSAKPQGDSGIYVTTDNGHWYYYNDGWKDGGVYQASASLSQTADKVLYSTIDLTTLQKWNELNYTVNQDSIIETSNISGNAGLIVDVPFGTKYLNVKIIEKNATAIQLYKYDTTAPNGVGTLLEDINVSVGSIYTYSLTEYGKYMIAFINGLTNRLKIATSNIKAVDLTDVLKTFDSSLDTSKLLDKEALGNVVNLETISSFGWATLKMLPYQVTATVHINNGGLVTKQFSAYSDRVVLYTDLTFTQKAITTQISYVDKTDNQRKYKTINKYVGGKVDKVEFDASNLVIYSNADPNTFKLLMQANIDSAPDNDPIGDITLRSLSILDAGGREDVSSNPIYEPNLKLTLSNIIDEISKLNNSLVNLQNKGTFVTLPDGSERKLVYVNGQVTIKSDIYNKVLLIGNSLLLGFSTDGSHGSPFGATASDSKHDWSYLLTEKLNVKSPNVTINKLHVAKFEQSESNAVSESYIANEFAKAEKGNDLVIVQIGDNVNTELRNETFRNNFSKLINAIRVSNPIADIVVAGAWFNGRGIESWLQSQSSALNYTFVPLSDLCTADNMATLGDTVTFNDGVKMQVFEAIRTHPGDKGMQAIADRIYDNL